MYKDVSFVFKTHPRGVLKRKELHARIKDAKITSNFKIETNLNKIVSIMMDNDLKIEMNEK